MPAETVVLVLRDLTRLLPRVRLEFDAGPSGPGVVPVLTPADLWRAAPRMMRRCADLIDAGAVAAEPTCSPDGLRGMADRIERGGYPATLEAGAGV